MPRESEFNKTLSATSSLERELHLKQLQINRLLNITQAINNNLSASDLFKMYNSFLSWEMDVKKMILFIKQDGAWECRSHIGVHEEITKMDVSHILPRYERLKNISEPDDPFLKEFEIVIPVKHKDSPIAYAFIGGCGDDDKVYNKVQFIITITNIIAVAIENKRLFKRQLEQERLKREMELASEMQKMLVPRTLPSNGRFELSSIYQPQIGVGGDYFDVMMLDEERLMLCIADISGKGVAAALLMANFQANLRLLVRQQNDLKEMMAILNKAVFQITEGDKYLTLFIGVFNSNTRMLQYINAGHIPPMIKSGAKIKSLEKGCTIIGNFEELPEIDRGEEQINKTPFW